MSETELKPKMNDKEKIDALMGTIESQKQTHDTLIKRLQEHEERGEMLKKSPPLTVKFKYSNETRELLFESSEIILEHARCYKRSTNEYKKGMRVVKEIKAMLDEKEPLK